jgi:urease accessory protein
MQSNRQFNRALIAAFFGLVASASQAHTGHGSSGLHEGLTHPFGLDHLLAMVAVGIWSVSALPTNKVWWGPAAFMSSLFISAFLGAMGVAIELIESSVSLSVVLLGAMLVLVQVQISYRVGLVLIAMASALHGLAHGAESPEPGFLTYALGFLVTTATLHFGGVVAGRAIKTCLPTNQSLIKTSLGLLFGGAGFYLFSQAV